MTGIVGETGEGCGGRIRTRTNRSGGVQGGISNGENVVIRAAFEPTATILRSQETVDVEATPRRWRAVAATTRASSPAPSPWWRR